jgi:hypothetical protein
LESAVSHLESGRSKNHDDPEPPFGNPGEIYHVQGSLTFSLFLIALCAAEQVAHSLNVSQ